MINLNNLNKFIPYECFKMEGLHFLKFLLEQDDLLCKIDLKEEYFSVLLNKKSQKFVRFQQFGNLYEFLCLCFGLGPAPRIFTILIKVPIATLEAGQHSNHYLPRQYVANGEDVTRTSHGKWHIDFSTATFGFCDKPKKSTMHPVKQIEFLCLVTDTEKMTFALSEKKLKHASQQCQEIFKQPKTSVLNLTKLIGLLSSTVQAILLARIQFQYLQQEQILPLQKKGSYNGHVILRNLARESYFGG